MSIHFDKIIVLQFFSATSAQDPCDTESSKLDKQTKTTQQQIQSYPKKENVPHFE